MENEIKIFANICPDKFDSKCFPCLVCNGKQQIDLIDSSFPFLWLTPLDKEKSYTEKTSIFKTRNKIQNSPQL